MDCETNYQLCLFLNVAGQLLPQIFQVPLFLIGFLLPFWVTRQLMKSISGGDDRPHIIAQPLPLQPKSETLPEPKPQPTAVKPKPLISLEDVLTLIEIAREATRPANCPQCGAPREPNQAQCSHCGRSL